VGRPSPPENAAAGTIAGVLAAPGERTSFPFRGRKGDTIVAEVMARRLGSPLDSTLEIIDAAGRRIGWNDDRLDPAFGLLTHHADSYLMVTLPADGEYVARVGDAQQHGGSEHTFRLRLGAPQPDFELRVSPSTINLLPAAHTPVTVTAIRRDGFDGPIALTLKGAPPGTLLSGGTIPPGADVVRVTVAAAGGLIRDPTPIRLEGRATIGDRSVAHDAVAADDRTQAFAYHHLVPADQLRIAMAERGGTRAGIRLLGPTSVRLAPGESIRVRAALPPAYATFENIAFELDAGPAGVTVGGSYVASTQVEFLIQADASKARPGLGGNLIVLMTGERVPPPNAQNQARRRVPIGVLPAIPFEVVR
jgi:hypothetical protein